MSVVDAKKINSNNIKDYIGAKVDYKSLQGGTQRVFYFDGPEAYFGRANTVYLKRDYDSGETVNPESKTGKI